MAQVKRYSPETRDRAIRMVLDHRGSIWYSGGILSQLMDGP